MDTKIKLLFVYNADSTLFDQVSDAIKKIVTPRAYTCNLCMVTYGAVSMKVEWKEFLGALKFDREFLHRDEFHGRYPVFKDVKLPAVFIIKNNNPNLLIPADEINVQKDIAGLKKLITNKVTQYE